MNFWKASTIVLTCALGAVVAYETQHTAQADEQPNMQAALQSLELAQKKLENANDDKGGFRVKAISNTKDAIENTKKGIAWDNTHRGEKKN